MTYGVDKSGLESLCVHYMAVGHVGVFETIFKCKTFYTLSSALYICVWVDQDHNTMKADSVKNVNHRTEKVEKSTQILLVSLK